MQYNIQYWIPRLCVHIFCHPCSFFVKSLIREKNLKTSHFTFKKKLVSDVGEEKLGLKNYLLLSEKYQNAVEEKWGH